MTHPFLVFDRSLIVFLRDQSSMRFEVSVLFTDVAFRFGKNMFGSNCCVATSLDETVEVDQSE